MTGLDRFTLAGKNVLLTGSGGAIGSLLAVEVAAAGARVALQDLTEDRVSAPAQRIRDAGGEAITLAADLSDASTCADVVASAAGTLGGLDVLINCAGINRRKPIDDVTIDDFDAIVSVNMRSVFFLSQAAHPHFLSRGGGAIVNLSSLSARHSYRTISVYGATKAAVTGPSGGKRSPASAGVISWIDAGSAGAAVRSGSCSSVRYAVSQPASSSVRATTSLPQRAYPVSQAPSASSASMSWG